VVGSWGAATLEEITETDRPLRIANQARLRELLRVGCARRGYPTGMTEPDFQLTADDPMMDQIEAATAASRERVSEERPVASSDPLEPGEPESARFEPDASQ